MKAYLPSSFLFRLKEEYINSKLKHRKTEIKKQKTKKYYILGTFHEEFRWSGVWTRAKALRKSRIVTLEIVLWK